jgi:hypothetical protein
MKSLLLAALGGAGGLFPGYLGRNAIPHLLSSGWQRDEINVPFDWRVFAFTAAVTMVTGVLFGLAPALGPYIAASMSSVRFLPEGETADRNKKQVENFNLVGNNFFQALGIPIVAGRSFGPEDTEASERVGIIHQNLARKRFPGMNPVGKRFRVPNMFKEDWVRVIGICADTHYDRLQGDPPPQFLLPYVQQKEMTGMTFAVRSPMEPAALVSELHRVVQRLDRDLPVANVRTQREQIDESIQTERTFAALTAGFSVLALALACVGIYGIMAYSVANRKNEIGIRLALGAQPGQVRSMILRESTGLAAAGIAVGVAAVFWANPAS